ncbi:hypothetical protein I547_2496 [Mycobacterium kansasii 824]|uniref:Uncharacterized protein n=1 Tax=Mycobacterium kansasii TaxID=1768 RepID=A0A1V3WWM5_MYCKA|nr:hypothetical protein I547_2496 [Mycobacterium kansasii 824]OOK71148.1 hypothetical protein BZL29_5723 [Mycobacterium kansasii]OOK76362.1 hypothetical protein BZL30_4208 [Mycobacterium kansasii]
MRRSTSPHPDADLSRRRVQPGAKQGSCIVLLGIHFALNAHPAMSDIEP